jgi:hypothetical protein
MHAYLIAFVMFVSCGLTALALAKTLSSLDQSE